MNTAAQRGLERMHKQIFAGLLFIFFWQCLSAQKIIVIDASDHKPVKDVAVYNDNKTRFGYTDLAGEFSIDSFDDDDYLNFQHPSYENIRLTRKEIEDSDYVVFMFYLTFDIEEFVVSANRWEQSTMEVPNKIVQVRKPEIDFANAQTAADLLGSSDEVYIQKSQLGGGSPMIRGFSTNRVLLVVDGVRMNNAIFREGNVQNVISLDPNIMESTEIIFGPGAVVYGSDAIGGVMNFNSRKALLSTSEKTNVKVEAMGRRSTANNETTGHVNFNIGGSKIAFLSSVTLSTFGDLRMGNTRHPEYTRPHYQKQVDGVDSMFVNTDPDLQVGTAYSQYNFTEKLRFQPNESLNVVFASHISRSSDVPRYDRLIEYSGDVLKYGDWYYGPQKWMMNSVNVDWKPGSLIFDKMKMVVARQDFGESRHDRKFDNPVLRQRYEKVIAYSANIDFDKALGKNEIYYGAEAVINDITSTGKEWNIDTELASPTASRYPDGENKYYTMAAYAGFNFDISSRLFINTGARINYSELHSTIVDNSFYNFPFTKIDLTNSAVTGSVGLVFLPNEKTKLNLNISTGYRSPNLDDVGKVFDSEPGNVVVPNPDLNPEYAWNIDIGMSKDLFQTVKLDLVAYATLLENAMVRREFSFDGQDSIMYSGEMSKVLAIVNGDNAMVYGAHAGIEVAPLKSLRIKSTLNYTKGEDQDGTPLRHVSPLYGSTHFVYESKKFKADLYAIYNGEIKYSEMAPSEQDKPLIYASDEDGNPYSPSWYTLNLKTSYQLGTFGILNAGIENILNHRYRPYSSGIVASGRNFIISLRVFI